MDLGIEIPDIDSYRFPKLESLQQREAFGLKFSAKPCGNELKQRNGFDSLRIANQCRANSFYC